MAVSLLKHPTPKGRGEKTLRRRWDNVQWNPIGIVTGEKYSYTNPNGDKYQVRYDLRTGQCVCSCPARPLRQCPKCDNWTFLDDCRKCGLCIVDVPLQPCKHSTDFMAYVDKKISDGDCPMWRRTAADYCGCERSNPCYERLGYSAAAQGFGNIFPLWLCKCGEIVAVTPSGQLYRFITREGKR